MKKNGYPNAEFTKVNHPSSNARVKAHRESAVPKHSQARISTPTIKTDHIDFSPYSEEERKIILGVLKKDLEVRVMEKARLKKMRNEILSEDRKTKTPTPSSSSTPSCSLCGSSFMILLRPRKSCDLCHRSICSACCRYYNEINQLLCTLCSRAQFYKAMVHQWFYENAPNKFNDFASSCIVKDIFKDKLPALPSIPDEELHDIVALYLGPTRNAVINDKLITPEMMRKIKMEQLKTFRSKYNETREEAISKLIHIKSDTKLSTSDREKMIETTTSKFLEKAKTHLNQLLQMLCITAEKNNIALGLDSKQTNARVLRVAQKEVELIVGHPITLPADLLTVMDDEDWESYVGSVTGEPEEFFVQYFLEDIKNALAKKQKMSQR